MPPHAVALSLAPAGCAYARAPATFTLARMRADCAHVDNFSADNRSDPARSGSFWGCDAGEFDQSMRGVDQLRTSSTDLGHNSDWLPTSSELFRPIRGRFEQAEVAVDQVLGMFGACSGGIGLQFMRLRSVGKVRAEMPCPCSITPTLRMVGRDRSHTSNAPSAACNPSAFDRPALECDVGMVVRIKEVANETDARSASSQRPTESVGAGLSGRCEYVVFCRVEISWHRYFLICAFFCNIWEQDCPRYRLRQ